MSIFKYADFTDWRFASEYNIANLWPTSPYPLKVGLLSNIPNIFSIHPSISHISCTNHLEWGFIIYYWCRFIYAVNN